MTKIRIILPVLLAALLAGGGCASPSTRSTSAEAYQSGFADEAERAPALPVDGGKSEPVGVAVGVTLFGAMLATALGEEKKPVDYYPGHAPFPPATDSSAPLLTPLPVVPAP